MFYSNDSFVSDVNIFRKARCTSYAVKQGQRSVHSAAVSFEAVRSIGEVDENLVVGNVRPALSQSRSHSEYWQWLFRRPLGLFGLRKLRF